jgi:hypothetical protein
MAVTPENRKSRLDRIERNLAELAEEHERIKDRHQALAESVELLSDMQHKTDQRLESFVNKTEERFAQLMDAMLRLIRIVEAQVDGRGPRPSQ